jgi:hypothetical protein
MERGHAPYESPDEQLISLLPLVTDAYRELGQVASLIKHAECKHGPKD